MPAPNPFIFNSTVPPALFVGREKKLQMIIDRLCNPIRESTSIVAADRMGRTSLLRYLTSVELRGQRPELQSFVPIFLDGIEARNLPEHDVWKWIFQSAQEAYFDNSLDVQFDKVIQSAEDQSISIRLIRSELFARLAANGHILLIAIDDFYHLINNLQLPVSFFGMLRSLMIHPPLVLTLVVATPRPLIDLWKLGPGGSPFYNHFANLSLGRFSDEVVDQLLDKWLAESEITFTDVDRELVKRYSGNHPMLVQYVAYLLYDCYLNDVADKVAAISQAITAPNGHVNMLQRNLLGQLTEEERVALDTFLNSPQSLSRRQSSLLEQLDRRGALPPGVSLK